VGDLRRDQRTEALGLGASRGDQEAGRGGGGGEYGRVEVSLTSRKVERGDPIGGKRFLVSENYNLGVVSEKLISACHVTATLLARRGIWWGDPAEPGSSMLAVLEMLGAGPFPPGTPFGMPTPPSITAIETVESRVRASEKRVARKVAGSKFP
jgi:hypothetical protein